MSLRTSFMPLGFGTQKRWKVIVDNQIYDLKTARLEKDLTNEYETGSILSICDVFVANNNVYLLNSSPTSYVYTGVKQYLPKTKSVISLNNQTLSNAATIATIGKVMNDELFLNPQQFDLYGFSYAQLLKFNAKTNTWSENLAPTGIISSMTYGYGGYWINGSQGSSRRCSTQPSLTSWVNVSVPNPNSTISSYTTPIACTQNVAYALINAVSNQKKGGYIYKYNGVNFTLISSWLNGTNNGVYYTLASEGEDFAAIVAQLGYTPAPNSGNYKFLVALDETKDLVQKRTPNDEHVSCCKRLGKDILVLTCKADSTGRLYKTQDFETYDLLIDNINTIGKMNGSSWVTGKLNLFYV